jgi:hypothetical protein
MTQTRLFCLGAIAVVAVVALAGCEDRGIGRLCDIGVDAGTTTSSESIINGAALECPSRICLKAVPNTPTTNNSFYKDESPQCSDLCSSDDDCSDSLQSKTQKELCHTGFKCAVATTVGGFACKKMCICGDFLQPPIQTPAACTMR